MAVGVVPGVKQEVAAVDQPSAAVRQIGAREGQQLAGRVMGELDKICPRLINFAGDLGFASLEGAPLAGRPPAEQRRVLEAVAEAARRHQGALPPAGAFVDPSQREQLVTALQFIERESAAQLGTLAARQHARTHQESPLSPAEALRPGAGQADGLLARNHQAAVDQLRRLR